MQCDAPYGAYLSGGVDSSSVASLMSRFQSRPIKTFCLGYTDEAEGQFVGKHRDIEYARAMSRRLNSEHHEYLISARDFADRMPDVLRSFDEPYSGAVSTFFMTILLTQHVKVALSGDGADELFGSYLAHRLAFPIENYLELARGSKVEWADLNEEDRERFRPFGFSDSFELLQDVASDNIAEWRSRLHVFSQAERTELLSQDFLEAAGRPAGDEPYRTLGAGLTAKDALNRSLEIDQKELLPNQVLPFVDRLSMAFSVEVRCPYLDYRIIEFANRLPGRMKIRRGENKYVHRLSIEDLIPDEIVNRPKEGFVQPIYSWMHGKLKDWTLEQIAGLPKSLFNRDALERHAQKFEGGDQSENARIWNLVCFSIWHREVCSDR
jgi:asparagine synthase (glutamine-hydrolysing)